MQDFRNLKVWAKAHQLTLTVYKATRQFPKEELYGITSQIRRACVSICSNIAEGCGRKGDREFSRFLHIAMGSACETEYLLMLAQDLGLMSTSEYGVFSTEITQVKKMITVFLQKLKADG